MCPNCNMQVVQTIGHATVWPKFKDARMVAHDDAWEAVASVLQQLVGPESAWQFQWGTAVSSSPCCTLLRPVIQHLPAPTPPKRWIIEELARLRPDGLAVNTAQHSIVILEFCCPSESDSHPRQLRAAFNRKDLKYQVLVEALQHHDWSVSLAPLVVGVQGLVVMEGVNQAITALGLPASAAAPLAGAMALASVDAFMYLHLL